MHFEACDFKDYKVSFSSPVGSMKARIPRMLLTVCAEGQALEMLTCPAVTGTPGGLPILVLVGDIVLG